MKTMNRRHFLTTVATATAAQPIANLLAADETKPTALADHRIVSLETKPVKVTWPRHVGKNAKLNNHGFGPTLNVVILKTDQGATGWGEVGGDTEALRSAVIGKPVSALFAPATGILDPNLRPLDIALHDLAGVILGLPVWKMIGGGAQPFLPPIYSGMVYFDELDPTAGNTGIQQVLKNCAWDREYGYRQLKVKIGRNLKWMPGAPGLQRDIEVVQAIAKEFPDCEILVDSNDGYTADEAIAFLRGIGDIPIFWFEEPFVETIADWTKLHQWAQANGRSKMLLADGEQGNNYPVLEKLQAEGILNVRLDDIIGYGFTPWREMMPRLRAIKAQASPHNWGSALKTVYTAHLIAALGNSPSLEGVTTNTKEVDFGDNIIRDGKLQVSSAPGFGLKLTV
jgi:D-galactarolactone cycloisomerase